jgi:8-oxo-dGTP pyrophosphatase MutT (NUDIX family)
MSYIGSYVWKLRQALGSQRILVAGVGLFVLSPEGKVWLGKRAAGGEWAYFGGAVELGDSVMGTVLKETHEELGLRTTAADWTYIGVHSNPEQMVYTYPNGDEVQIVNHVFYTTHSGPLSNGEDEEHTEFGLFSFDDLPSPLKNDFVHAVPLLKAFLQTGKVQVS